MARSKTEFVLTGPREGQDFSPKGLPGVHFVKGVYVSEVDFEKVPHLARVLETYGAFPKSKLPTASTEPKGQKVAKKKKSQGKSPAKAGKPTDQTPAPGSKPTGASDAPEGTQTNVKDGSGETGAQGQKTDEDLI